MAKNTSNRFYLIAVACSVLMGLFTYWMYKDTKQSEKDAQIRREHEAQIVPTKAPPVLAPGENKVTGVLGSILNNPLQGRGPQKPAVHVVDGNTPTTSAPGAPVVCTPATKENFYQDSK